MILTDDIKKFEGNNNLSAREIFYWRDIYKTYSPVYNSLDMYYEDVFYGRTDQSGVAVYPSESALKQLASSKTIYNINFVADAWEGFRKDVKRSVANGSIKEDSIYSGLEPLTGWKSIHIAYHEWNNNLYQLFFGDFINSLLDQRIIDFEGFVNVYLEFIDKITRFFPYTRESFILSRICSPLVSGLIIEIAKLSYSSDLAKKQYLQDSGYNKVVRIAKRHGFKIDKNAPWRFIADLESNSMKGYINQYTLPNEDKGVLEQTYYKSYEHDLELFKHYMWTWYDQYTKFSPFVGKIVSGQSSTQSLFEKKDCKGKTIVLKYKREVLTKEQAFERFPNEFWIRLYTYVRAKEAQKRWHQPKFDKVVKKTLSLIRIKQDKNKAMKYLYKEIETPGKKRLEMKKSFTKEQISDILIEKGPKKHKGTFNF